MKTTGNTILITGGGSGIGRGLAEAFHRLGNQVIIAGRRRANLDETIAANPGMRAIELDIADPRSIASAAETLLANWPSLNVLINNAGVMHIDDLGHPVDDAMLVSTLTTNLMGPIRMTGSLVEHLKQQRDATIINVSSVLGFVPMAIAGVYSSTKAAIHSYTQSLRYKLKDTSVRVVEIAPPWVQTDLLDSKNEPRAMPLASFIEQTMHELDTDANEALVEIARPIRNHAGPNEAAFVTQFNDMFS
ncbi:SDR family NAD(P)-dependent oxidoreductase [Burkholderia sp. Ac-20344]|uniref:SDR family oxidoreductase n=1 Tax=Burkholderia sp. Ac-20344 TaxID=2703890 RepID=UPI00197C5C1F|nr:SDR family NAD(P)-dependent oxidoreductase [Burkholderia sp. Ac-20344]MBN3834444.1 SDR family NAD(P)-dependent oxidoreductase [Burkholderia sp. Ac-20344]